ncbi:uncharacterized protein FIBRA_07482 [Fibroporia radiculosa]|uniref:Uncharacterized protein n=1 Tax=Fibroporia radiculosa TaxID=599839 RepID=J4GV23_9APHY|nr:uncharacterized protein FIBRA_07482 [Fibroporia radiculosa]CCM05270.1 predicted protein [Fibroporia radiculosa]
MGGKKRRSNRPISRPITMAPQTTSTSSRNSCAISSSTPAAQTRKPSQRAQRLRLLQALQRPLLERRQMRSTPYSGSRPTSPLCPL